MMGTGHIETIANFFADASPGEKGLSLALREAATRCATRGIFFFCLTHVRRNLQDMFM